MLAGLPVIIFTAFAQRVSHRAYTATPGRLPEHGTLATMALKASPHLSWHRAWLGGGIAVGAFAALVIGFMVFRALGIGPMASLRGAGVFGSSELLMVADFRSLQNDSTLGISLAEAIRTDLAQSKSLRVVNRSAIRDRLGLMQRPLDEPILFELARDIGTTEGAKAILDGSVSRVGSSYVIAARLVSTLDGKQLADFSQQAATEDDILAALGRLTREVRTKAGESLKTIRASTELERVTTPSMLALRKYVEGSRLADEDGQIERGIELLREAVAVDTAFAMAWRKLGVLLSNEARNPVEILEAVSTAYLHRNRLTEMERQLTEAFYYTAGPKPDRGKALAAYEAAARIDSLSTAAINNAGTIHSEMNNSEKAEEYFRRVVRLPRGFGGAYTNLLQEQIRNGRSPATLDSTVAMFAEALRRLGELHEARGERAKAIDYYTRFTDQWADADAILQPLVQDVRGRISRLRVEGG